MTEQKICSVGGDSGCNQPGTELFTGVVLCKRHCERAFHKLNNILRAERLRENRAQAEKKKKDREARQIASPMGYRPQQMDITKGPVRREISSAIETNRRRH